MKSSGKDDPGVPQIECRAECPEEEMVGVGPSGAPSMWSSLGLPYYLPESCPVCMCVGRSEPETLVVYLLPFCRFGFFLVF